MSACIALLIVASVHSEPSYTTEARACVPGVTSPVASDINREARCIAFAESTIRTLQWGGVLPGAHETISYTIRSCDTSI